MKDKQIDFDDFVDRFYMAIEESTNIPADILRAKYSNKHVSGSKKLFASIKKEITRDSVWDNGCRLVLFGAIPVIIVTIIYSLVEYFA